MRTLALDVADWPDHRAGQHVDVRLTAEDGYQAERAYSIASAPGEPLAITVEKLEDGEVSPYLVDVAARRATRSTSAGRSAATSSGTGARRAAAPRRRRLGRRAAAGDDPAPPPQRQRRARAAALLVAHARGRHLPRGAGGAGRRPRGGRHADARAAGRLDRPYAAASTPRCSARSPGPPADGATRIRLRAHELRRGGRERAWWSSATTRRA